MTPNRRRLIEAMFMSDTGDDRSYDDIYGENGVATDDTELTSSDAAVPTLSADDIAKLKDLANQILTILGGNQTGELDDTSLAGDDPAALPETDSDLDAVEQM